MSQNENKIDSIIQFALLLAGEQDSKFDKQLGPIHLIKYVYLADLLYAKRNNGETFTGVDWKFHNFGPWSQEVNARIEPALKAIGADCENFSSDYGADDWVRWSYENDGLLKQCKSNLPSCISLALPNKVKAYLKDTPSLLDFVYSTEPMLNAAPGEYLKFNFKRADQETVETFQSAYESLSNTKKKKFIAKKKELQKKLHANKKPKEPVAESGSELYDQVYKQGVDWLDSLAGEPISEKKVKVKFSPDVWKSNARKGNGVS